MTTTFNEPRTNRQDCPLARDIPGPTTAAVMPTPLREAAELSEFDVTDPRHAKTAHRVLETLDRWDERLNGSFHGLRKHARSKFFSLVTVLIPASELGGQPGEPPILLKAWCRNISQGGLSFVFPRKLPADRILVGVGVEPNQKWFQAEIVRTRQVIENYWEHGVAFKSRAQA